MATPTVRCHYEVLGIPQFADASLIKKAHRKMALKLHPDKNIGDDSAAEQFRLVQQAYECLSDPQERKWYDDHRDAILAGWSSGGAPDDGEMASMMIFDVVHFMHPGCYSGYHDRKGGFYEVYTSVFVEIVACERKQTDKSVELPTNFGNADTAWKELQQFYQIWESFVSALNFAWEDKYNSREDAPDRRVRRLMEEDNKKARRAAKKTYNQDILALVAFVKRRDPRVKAKQQEMELQKLEQQKRQKEQAAQKKVQQQKAKEAWMEEAQKAAEEAEEADRLAGRVRLADLEDDYDYGGGKKKRGKGKKKKNKQLEEEEEEDDVVAPATAGEETAEPTSENAETEGGAKETELNGEAGAKTVEAGDTEAVVGGETKLNAESEEKALEAGASTENEEQEPAPIIADEPATLEEDAYSESEEESEEELDFWRCECCRKDFKSEGQMENHMKSKKHKEAFKKYQAKAKKQEDELLANLMDEVAMEP